MRNYLSTIYLHDASQRHSSKICCQGRFANDWDAIDAMTSAFFNAQSIRVRRLA